MQALSEKDTSELVEMLIKDTEYYMDLCRLEGNYPQREIVKKHIELVTAEIQSREGNKAVFEDDTTEKTGE